jgi:hypothetical protein
MLLVAPPVPLCFFEAGCVKPDALRKRRYRARRLAEKQSSLQLGAAVNNALKEALAAEQQAKLVLQLKQTYAKLQDAEQRAAESDFEHEEAFVASAAARLADKRELEAGKEREAVLAERLAAAQQRMRSFKVPLQPPSSGPIGRKNQMLGAVNCAVAPPPLPPADGLHSLFETVIIPNNVKRREREDQARVDAQANLKRRVFAQARCLEFCALATRLSKLALGT